MHQVFIIIVISRATNIANIGNNAEKPKQPSWGAPPAMHVCAGALDVKHVSLKWAMHDVSAKPGHLCTSGI